MGMRLGNQQGWSYFIKEQKKRLAGEIAINKGSCSLEKENELSLWKMNCLLTAGRKGEQTVAQDILICSSSVSLPPTQLTSLCLFILFFSRDFLITFSLFSQFKSNDGVIISCKSECLKMKRPALEVRTEANLKLHLFPTAFLEISSWESS